MGLQPSTTCPFRCGAHKGTICELVYYHARGCITKQVAYVLMPPCMQQQQHVCGKMSGMKHMCGRVKVQAACCAFVWEGRQGEWHAVCAWIRHGACILIVTVVTAALCFMCCDRPHHHIVNFHPSFLLRSLTVAVSLAVCMFGCVVFALVHLYVECVVNAARHTIVLSRWCSLALLLWRLKLQLVGIVGVCFALARRSARGSAAVFA